MNRKIELLAPGGDLDSIKAAIVAGADAVYCGLHKFNARNRATNIEFDDFRLIISLAHRHGCQIFLTLNIIIAENEIRALIKLLNQLVNLRLDGIIVQDLGLLYLLSRYYKNLPIHASTQLTTHNAGQIKFLAQLGVTRVNLSRELNISEIGELTQVAHEHNLATEVFVHGSNCLSFSGLCYISSVHEGKSGNRGRCSQPCRDAYRETAAGKDFPLNLKDNSAYHDLPLLSAAGVDSLKIEGRMKAFHYVYTVVDAWRRRLDNFYLGQGTPDDSALYQVFNRDFTNAFLQGVVDKEMFIDNPRDNAAQHFGAGVVGATPDSITGIKNDIHASRSKIIREVEAKIAALTTAKRPLRLSLSGMKGMPLRVSVWTADSNFEVCSESRLVPVGRRGRQEIKGQPQPEQLDAASLGQRFGALHDTDYYLEQLDLDPLQGGLFLPFKELSAIKQSILLRLRGDRADIPAFDPPRLTLPRRAEAKPTLAILVSDRQQLELVAETGAQLFFQLPNCFKPDYADLLELFRRSPRLTPWFPAVLIGKHYTAAVDILERLRPQLILTDNSGIAYRAYQLGIPWIAGPCLNTVNSYSLLCMKEEFNGVGAFISNEISRRQLEKIVAPEEFKLYYSIYHPIPLMTSRQCLHLQIDGCEKSIIDEDCLLNCNRTTTLTNMKNGVLFVEKSAGCYQRVYNDQNYLNTAVVADLPQLFSAYLIDLSGIRTATQVGLETIPLIRQFEKLLEGDVEAGRRLEELIQPTTSVQYTKGI